MITGHHKAVPVVKTVGEETVRIHVEHHELRFFFHSFRFQPCHQGGTQSRTAICVIDDKIIHIERAPAPEAHAKPKTADGDHFPTVEGGNSAIAEW